MQVPSASSLLRRGPGSWVLLTGLHAGNAQQLPGSAWPHIGDGGGGERRCSLSHLKGHAGHHMLLLTATFPLPIPFLSMGKRFARYGMTCCGKWQLLALNSLLHQQCMGERSLHIPSRAALFSSLQGLLSGGLVWEDGQGSRKGESLLVVETWLLCPNTSVNEQEGRCLVWK